MAVNNYSRFDRLVHRIAFLSPRVQIVAAEMEDTLFKDAAATAPSVAPVFVTSLPRGGTTILLSALHEIPGFSAHLYRDMPFIMAPVLWSRLNGSFRREATLQQRAHGDGLEIGYDSPEAFEEVIWRAFWPDKYSETGIKLWDRADAKDDATAFFNRHFRKIVALRQGKEAAKGGYLSKNNGNIARLDLILAMFPDARILVPIRHPLEHAASLHRQHMNFLKQHAADAFSRRYMGDIGHYEFGALHRPIRFDGFDELSQGRNPEQLEYWVAYWIAAFAHISRFRDRIKLIAQEQMGTHPREVGAALCSFLGLDPDLADRIGGHFRQTANASPDLRIDAPDLMERAGDLYSELTS